MISGQYIYLIIAIVLGIISFVFIKIYKNPKGKKYSIIDFLLVWPLILRSKSGPREGKFVIIGVLIMLALIACSFLVNK